MKRRNFIKLNLLGFLPINTKTLLLTSLKDQTELIVIYNNLSSTKKLKDDWGLSIWIKTPTHNVLFDTGRKGDILISNMKELSLEPQQLDFIILSHIHGDHVGGLKELAPKLKKKVKIFVPKETYLELKNRHRELDFIGVTKPVDVCKNIQTTGQHFGNSNIAEQAAIIKTNNGLTLVTGCSHPGVDILVEQVNKMYPDTSINLLTGGFHLGNLNKTEVFELSKKLKDMNIKIIAPSHCTGKQAIEVFADEWQNSYKKIYLGYNNLI